jgi:RND family efflux transporter MFP subunit
MLIVLSIFFLIVWLIFFKLEWLPWSRGWKVTVYSLALGITLVVVGALQHYTPVSAKAVVSAPTQQIYPLVTGRVETVYLHGAHAVSKGEKLFSIDARPFEYTVNKWTASVKLAEIELADAQKLVTGGNIARITLDQKQAAYDQARAELENAQYELENTIVLAPSDGYITLNTLRPGQRVSKLTAALTFIDMSDLFIVAIIKQNGLPRISPGKPATVTFSAAPGDIFQTQVADSVMGVIQGQVTMESGSSPIQAVNDARDVYPVRIAFPEGAPSELRQPGKLANVTVFTDEGNPINILAKILQWISTWLDFVL